MDLPFDIDYINNTTKKIDYNIKIRKQIIKRSKKWNYLFNFYEQNYNIDPHKINHYAKIINNNSYIFKQSYEKIEHPSIFFQKIDKLIKKQKIINFFKKTLGKKFDSLFNEIVFKYMQKLKLTDSFLSEVKKTIQSNIYTYENFIFLIKDIQNIYNNIHNWNFEYFKNKIDIKNIISFENNILIFKTNSFKEHKEFSSRKWCTNNLFDYNNYIPQGVHQFLKYDFNLTFNNNFSIVGFTYDKGLVHCFNNNNDICQLDDIYLKKIKKLF